MLLCVTIEKKKDASYSFVGICCKGRIGRGTDVDVNTSIATGRGVGMDVGEDMDTYLATWMYKETSVYA